MHAAARRGSRSLRRVRGWTLALIGAMTVALMAALVVQTRQLSAMQSSLGFRSDYTVWAFFQIELEALRLRERLAMRLAEDPLREADDTLLRRSYEIFASRITLVRPERAVEGLPVLPGQREAVNLIDAFVARFDPWLSETSTATIPQAVVLEAATQLEALGPRLRDLAVGIQHAYADLSARRVADLETQVRITVALSLLQVAMLASFTTLLVMHLRALAARRRRLIDALRRLRLAQRASRQASEAKTRFLANMSHEIRTPLQGVLGQLSLLSGEALSAEHAQHVHVAQDSAQQLLAVLNDVIDVTRIESGRMRLVPAPCRPRDVAAQAVELFRPVASQKGLTLDHAFAEGVPPVVVIDVARLRQVLMNLLSNAVKFTDRGGVTLRLSAEPGADATRAMLAFSVEDTGIGMDESTRAGLFQRFYQADSTIRRRHGGSGLGLEISLGLARLMGGEITVTSQPGAGSCFTLRVGVSVVADVAQPAQAGPIAARPAAALPPTRALRVLVADDNAINRRFLGHALAALGHETVFAEDGAAAVERVLAENFDVVLMDVHMPVLDGLEATRRIRDLGPQRGGLPIVAVTADVLPETAERAASAGITAMLYKPFRKDDIAVLLAAFFGAQSLVA